MDCRELLGQAEIEVAVLGPLEVRGAAQPFGRTAAKELVVYLAIHRQGAPYDVWGAALWPDRCVAASTLHSTASVARRALGRSRGGIAHLPRNGRRLRLADTVVTDVERFRAAAQGPESSDWVTALSLVRGRPFEGLSLSDWAVLDGSQAEVESMVVDTALKAAVHSLQHGRGAEAEWMIRRGLRARPYDERLWRALLWAADAKGDRTGMRATMDELLTLAAEVMRPEGTAGGMSRGTASLEALHPQTVALYRELALGEPAASGGCPSRL
jgi:DNA-binding SARP family transcriptional activator